MEYFSTNAFILGAMLFACLYLSNVLYSLFCIFFKIKILEFSIFYNPWFSIHHEKILGTNFSLGWLPIGGFIKPLGMTTDEEEKNKISQLDLPFAFFNKPQYLKTIFNLVPWFIYIFAFALAFIIFENNTNLIGAFKSLSNYQIETFSAIFSGESEKENFIISSKKILANKSIVLFAFIQLIFVMLLFIPMTSILNWYSNDKINKSKFHKAIGYMINIGILWLVLWKIPKFIFSFFTLAQSLIYILSFTIGMFSSGLVFYFTTMFIIKNIAQNFKDGKIE